MDEFEKLKQELIHCQRCQNILTPRPIFQGKERTYHANKSSTFKNGDGNRKTFQ